MSAFTPPAHHPTRPVSSRGRPSTASAPTGARAAAATWAAGAPGQTPARVTLGDGVVRIRDLTIGDPALVALVAGSEDGGEAIVSQALTMGARVLTIAQASIDTQMVEKSFDALTAELTQQVGLASTALTRSATELLNDPNTGVAAKLSAWQRNVDQTMDATFNPDRASSAFGKLDRILKEASDDQLLATRRLLNPDSVDSPLARLMSGVKDQVGGVLDAIARLSAQIVAAQSGAAATAETMNKTAVKGFAFEDLVANAVTAIAAARHDVTTAVGLDKGATGMLVGDIVVTVDPTTTRGAGQYVLECKDTQMSLAKILKELGKAAENREAAASIAVFAQASECPVLVEPVSFFENQAVVLYDKVTLDPAALRLACTWARWVVQRATHADNAGIDVEAIEGLLEDARTVLNRRATIRRAHTTAMHHIAQAVTAVDLMHDEFSDLIESIEECLER